VERRECPWNMLDPHMESSKPPYKYIEPGKHLSTDVGHGGMNRLEKVGLEACL